MKLSEIEINTNEYEREHNRQPRGRGGWGFIDYQFSRRNDYLSFVFWGPCNTTFAASARLAKVHFQSVEGFSGEIVVCS